MSNWSCVTQLLEQKKPIHLGRYSSYQYLSTPRRLLYASSYYKFAAKMIGPNKRVLDVGCNEGLGSWLLAKECGACTGIDFDADAVDTAKKNFANDSISFVCTDFAEFQQNPWDAIVSFDVIEHIEPQNAFSFLQKMHEVLDENGVVVIGTPSEISQQFASAVSKKGHINIYSHERLEEELSAFFDFVFLFAAHDEVIHTGYLPLAHYLIALACKPK